jgi:hypothetical protein
MTDVGQWLAGLGLARSADLDERGRRLASRARHGQPGSMDGAIRQA